MSRGSEYTVAGGEDGELVPAPCPSTAPPASQGALRDPQGLNPARAWGGGSGVQETQGQMGLKGPGAGGQKAWDGESQQGLRGGLR